MAAATLELQPYFRALRTVRVATEAGDLTLLLDTGGGATLVTPGVAGRLGCQPFGRDVGHRMTGEQVEFKRCESLSLSAGTWHRRVEPVAVFDVNRLLPAELPRLDGVLALDAFQGEVVTIDWPAATLTVHPGPDAPAASRLHGVPVRVATGDSGRFYSAFIPVSGSRGDLWFLLDSGNIQGTLVAQHVVDDRLLDMLPRGDVSISIGRQPAVTMPARQAALMIDGALGTAFLMRGPVTLDLRRPLPCAAAGAADNASPGTGPSG